MILTASAAWAWGGSGTANDPYTIESIEDMNQIVESIDAGNSYDGMYFKLVANLDYTNVPVNSDGINFKPLGGNSRFWGNFDGGGNTISGIIVNRSPIKFIYEGKMLKDLTIKDATINCSKNGVGGMVGENAGTVENCHVINMTINGNGYDEIGGLVDNNVGTITSCTSNATITGGGDKVGGIAAYNQRHITNCAYLGTTIEGTRRVAAIAGYWDESTNSSMSGNIYVLNNLKAYCNYYNEGKDEKDNPHQNYYKVTPDNTITITRNGELKSTIGPVSIYDDGVSEENNHFFVEFSFREDVF